MSLKQANLMPYCPFGALVWAQVHAFGIGAVQKVMVDNYLQ
jgi:hypothetical protein